MGSYISYIEKTQLAIYIPFSEEWFYNTSIVAYNCSHKHYTYLYSYMHAFNHIAIIHSKLILVYRAQRTVRPCIIIQQFACSFPQAIITIATLATYIFSRQLAFRPIIHSYGGHFKLEHAGVLPCYRICGRYMTGLGL